MTSSLISPVEKKELEVSPELLAAHEKMVADWPELQRVAAGK
jgi:hypothetical protein